MPSDFLSRRIPFSGERLTRHRLVSQESGMASTKSCPAGADFDSLVEGVLPANQGEQMLQHVESCAHCQQTLRGLKGEDALVESLRTRKSLPDLSEEEPVARLMCKLRGLAALAADRGEKTTLPPGPASWE